MSNETKYTPGPWRYRLTMKAGSPVQGFVINAPMDSAGNTPVVAEIFPQPYLVMVREENARLIAAAPALLAALREVLPYVLMGSSGKTRHEFLENARAAIAQAEGSK